MKKQVIISLIGEIPQNVLMDEKQLSFIHRDIKRLLSKHIINPRELEIKEVGK